MKTDHTTIQSRIDMLKPKIESISKTATVVKVFLEDGMINISIAGMFDGTLAEVVKVCALIVKYFPDFPIVWFCTIRKGLFSVSIKK